MAAAADDDDDVSCCCCCCCAAALTLALFCSTNKMEPVGEGPGTKLDGSRHSRTEACGVAGPAGQPPGAPPPMPAAAQRCRRGVSALGPGGPNDQLLRLEAMGATPTRRLLGALAAARDCAVLLAIALLALRLHPIGKNGGGNEWFFCRLRAFAALNVAVGALSTAAAAAALAALLRQLLRSLRAARRWAPRRERMLGVQVAQTAVTLVGTACFLAANALALSAARGGGGACAGGAGAWRRAVEALAAVRWTCLNAFFLIQLVRAHSTCILAPAPPMPPPPTPPLPPGKQSEAGQRRGWGGGWGGWGACGGGERAAALLAKLPDAMVLDLPLWVHWPKLLLFGAFEAALAVLLASDRVAPGGPPDVSAPPASAAAAAVETGPLAADCSPSPRARLTPAATGALAALAALMGVYLVAWLGLLRRSARRLRERAWRPFRQANTLLRMEVLRGLGGWLGNTWGWHSLVCGLHAQPPPRTTSEPSSYCTALPLHLAKTPLTTAAPAPPRPLVRRPRRREPRRLLAGRL